MDIELIGVPFDGYGRPEHHARAPAALREAGLREALGPVTVHDRGDIRLPPFQTTRGPRSGLVNEPALEAMADRLHERVRAATAGGVLPVVVGGDCSLLLGALPGLRDANGAAGLLLLDGHEDTMPLDVVEDGEAANCEIGLLLGLTGRTLTGPLAARLPALDVGSLALLGQRDASWRRRFNVGSLADVGVWSRDLNQMRHTPADSGRAAAEHLNRTVASWWLHVDVDVLDPVLFPAQGLPGHPDEPDGLGLDALVAATAAAVAAGGCAGVSVAIYDPDQDPDRSGADQVLRLLRRTLDARV